MLVLVWLVVDDLYLFHLIVLLNPVPNCFKTLLSSWVDKVTTGTCIFVSVILSVAIFGLIAATAGSASGSASLAVLLVTAQFSKQVKIRSVSQLSNSIASVLIVQQFYWNVLIVQQFQLLFLYCYLLVFLQCLFYNQKTLNF